MKTRSLTLLTAVLTATVLVAGCSSTVDGDAQAPPTTSAGASTTPSDDEIQAALFSPCDDIPDDALRKTGVDPATEDPEVAGVEFTGWRVCRWNSVDGLYSLVVFSTSKTMDEIRSNPKNVDFQPITIGTRNATNYHESNDAEHARCDIAIAAGQGAYIVRASAMYGLAQKEDSCALATRHARDLEPILPR